MTNQNTFGKRWLTLLITLLWIVICIFLAVGTTTNNRIPEKMNSGTLQWSSSFGTGYANAPTPPIVHGAYVYIGASTSIRKLDKETGQEVGRVELVDSFGYATAALTYAENVDGQNIIFAPISEGRVQAIDADTMTSLWVTDTLTGQSCLARVTYDEGFIYYGTWKSEILPGMFLCYATTDDDPAATTESKTPIWQVSQKGGFYWSEASADGNYILFGSEDGNSGTIATTMDARIYSCLKGQDFINNNKTLKDSPIIDQVPIRGDVRSGVAYDDKTKAYYLTTAAGTLYKEKLNSDGTFKVLDGFPQSLELGGATTGTPTLDQGKIYLGIQGPLKFGDAGHAIKIIDGETMTVEDSCPTPGFVQAEMALVRSHKDVSTQYLYMTYNQLPGGIYVMEIHEQAGKKVIDRSGTGNYFTPPKNMQNYGISTLDVDEEGTLYYKNDSCNVMSIIKSVYK